MSEERRLAVLRAIVQDYVETSEPVGSKALLERHHLGVSAATVRNDMAALEEEGLIAAPHTSAGRVPTDAGYRLFVDRLSSVKPMSGAERAAIAQFLEGAVDLDDVVDRTVRLLASLTNQVAVMQYPSLTRSAVRHVELVPMGGDRLMIVLIVNTGRVEQRVIETSSVCRIVAGLSDGYCITVTWFVSEDISRTVRSTTSSRSTAWARKVCTAARSARDIGLISLRRSTNAR